MIGRFGGREFAVIYPEIELSSALIAGERLRRQIAGGMIPVGITQLCVTFSAGVVSLPLDEEITLDQFIEQADKALYPAEQKRNCMLFWDDAKDGPALCLIQ